MGQVKLGGELRIVIITSLMLLEFLDELLFVLQFFAEQRDLGAKVVELSTSARTFERRSVEVYSVEELGSANHSDASPVVGSV